MAKIVLFADGTGNARTARFRTNVWKLYSALDGQPDSGQVAFYHDGVGTSAFAPLRLLGGVFGFGLGRNVQQLYAFICRNIESADDPIHLFGFSRGAFTVRILAGLIHHQGVRPIKDEAELDRWVRQAYEANRLRLARAQVGRVRGWIFQAIEAAAAAVRPKAAYATPPLQPDIELLGVWDTVAAYGGPIVEVVRAFDRWVWPLSMPDYTLSATVRRARHALSLDEEREAFLPLPWDEVGSPEPERIVQTWFAGVHSDVGGGYADEGLSGCALVWMMDEAKAAGLSFMTDAERSIRATANPWAPMHDSRSGIAVGYRYQPRSIDALMGLTPNSPLRDPESGNRPLITKAVVHDSVLSRIRDPDGYAPIVLPTTFQVDDGTWITLPNEGRDHIWRLVGGRRWMQRLLLLTCLLAVFVPLFPRPPLVSLFDERLRVPFGAVLALIPLVPDWVKAAYAGSACWMLLVAGLAWTWIAAGDLYRQAIGRISAGMWALRQRTADPPAAPMPSRGNRSTSFRRAVLRRLRWRILPGFFGVGFYLVLMFAGLTATVQIAILVDEAKGTACRVVAPPGSAFAISDPCHALAVPMKKGTRYRVRLTVGTPWRADGVDTSPLGYSFVDSVKARFAGGGAGAAIETLGMRLFGMAARREIGAAWSAPVIAIQTTGGWLYTVPLSPRLGDDGAYYAHFTAPVDGSTRIYVNDAILPWGPPDRFYSRNSGTASVEIVSEY